MDFEARQDDIKSKRADGSGKWFVQSKNFDDWVTGAASPLIFCAGSGIPLHPRYLLTWPSWSGKIILDVCFIPGFAEIRSVVIDHLQTRFLNKAVGIAYIYFDYKNQEVQTAKSVVACLLRQMAANMVDLNVEIEKIYDHESKLLELATLVQI